MQHTKETGQKFLRDAIECLWEYTLGQPWLVSALAYEVCFEIKYILLVCDEYENIRRMKSDGRDEKRIARGLKTTRPIYDCYDYPKIDVTNLSIEETALNIAKIL